MNSGKLCLIATAGLQRNDSVGLGAASQNQLEIGRVQISGLLRRRRAAGEAGGLLEIGRPASATFPISSARSFLNDNLDPMSLQEMGVERSGVESNPNFGWTCLVLLLSHGF